MRGEGKPGGMCLAISCPPCYSRREKQKDQDKKDAIEAQRQALLQVQEEKLQERTDSALSKRSRNARMPPPDKTPSLGTSSTRPGSTNQKTCPGHEATHTLDHMELKDCIKDVLTRKYWGTNPQWPTHCCHCSCIIFRGSEKHLKQVLIEQNRDEFGRKL